MTQAYSNPARKNDPYALPDVEIFYDEGTKFPYQLRGNPDEEMNDDAIILESGWYYWYCLPGCLPDSDPFGPFASYDEALADAQADAWQFEDESDE